VRALGIIAALLILVVGGAMAYVRLAPSDPARWHVDPLMASGEAEASGGGIGLTPPGSAPIIRPPAGGAYLSAKIANPAPDGVGLLRDLDSIALSTPRTARVAGSPEEGRITWVTKSAFFGFPDYTTAEVRQDGPATLVYLYARQRFGSEDFGVNAARLKDWIGRLGESG
jgi:hypothetical protein